MIINLDFGYEALKYDVSHFDNTFACYLLTTLADTPNCLNGGTYYDFNETCSCLEGFTGEHCETSGKETLTQTTSPGSYVNNYSIYCVSSNQNIA